MKHINLQKAYAQAALGVDEVIVELRLMKAAITDLMEKRNENK
jgi:hypothetical protein